MTNSTERFGALVDDYLRYRPKYPAGLIDELKKRTGLTPDWTIADIGSGTGFSSEPFLENGNTVFGVEPNSEMRFAAVNYLSEHLKFVSIDATAEATSLAARSIDMILAGQAFHWFDRIASKKEFQRILKPEGWIVLLWNERLTDTTPFLQDYERLLQKFGTDYTSVDHRQMTPEVIQDFFAPANFESFSLPNEQRVDYAGLRGRLLSSSYVPHEGEEGHSAMLENLQSLFEKHSEAGHVVIEYECKVYLSISMSA